MSNLSSHCTYALPEVSFTANFDCISLYQVRPFTSPNIYILILGSFPLAGLWFKPVREADAIISFALVMAADLITFLLLSILIMVKHLRHEAENDTERNAKEINDDLRTRLINQARRPLLSEDLHPREASNRSQRQTVQIAESDHQDTRAIPSEAIRSARVRTSPEKQAQEEAFGSSIVNIGSPVKTPTKSPRAPQRKPVTVVNLSLGSENTRRPNMEELHGRGKDILGDITQNAPRGDFRPTVGYPASATPGGEKTLKLKLPELQSPQPKTPRKGSYLAGWEATSLGTVPEFSPDISQVSSHSHSEDLYENWPREDHF
jgi:hypothetical protein